MIWIFGHSFCLPVDVDESRGWPALLSQSLDQPVINLAEKAADNFFIYYSFLANRSRIKDDDLVIIGWSHPSRKSFVYDSNNPVHQQHAPNGIRYQVNDTVFFRSNNSANKWSAVMIPTARGNQFYDHWFGDYYSDLEQRTNFQSYLDSVQYNTTRYVPFFFSKESVQGIDADGAGYYLDFAMEHSAVIAKDNLHFDVRGHKLWAEKLLTYIDDNFKRF